MSEVLKLMGSMALRVVWLSIALVAAAIGLILLCTESHAAEPCTKMHGLQQQDVAPCTGIIGPEKTIRDGAKCIAPKGQLAGCKKTLELEKEGRQADKTKLESDLRIANGRADKCCKLALTPNVQVEELEWHEKPEFVAPVTVVITGLVVGLLVAVLYETGAVKL